MSGGRYGGDEIDFNALPKPEKSLYEQLKENRDKKNEFYEQKAVSRNATKRLDVGEVKHYDELRQKELERELEDQEEIRRAKEMRAGLEESRKLGSKPRPLPVFKELKSPINKRRISGLGVTKKPSEKSRVSIKKEDIEGEAAPKVEKKVVAYDSDSD